MMNRVSASHRVRRALVQGAGPQLQVIPRLYTRSLSVLLSFSVKNSVNKLVACQL
jgi:hypothetical protein